MTSDSDSNAGATPASPAHHHGHDDLPPRRPDGSSRPAMLVALAALAATVTAPYWTPPVYRFLHLRPPGVEWQARQDVETGRLVQSLSELDRRLAELTDAVAKTNKQTAGFKATEAGMETQVRVIALLQLRGMMRRPVPFDAELKVVKAFGGTFDTLAPLLESVESYSSIGIPLELQLRREFAGLADMLAYTETRPSMVHWLTNFTGWSKDPAPAEEAAHPERPSSIAARAQARLAENDLHGAVEILAALEGDAAAAVRPWLGQAQARLAANQADDIIAEYVATTLGRFLNRT
ncbi:COG4223 family protein [Azospirillum sp. TSH100]|uniref:COG4223 family protein n=1 Tax=Azospirillum sp. TSH100 TaxID=652764 RepID=UPI001FFEFCFC|nr:MICOS complex subunit MIC60 [Azospirillum sp. TSH100]